MTRAEALVRAADVLTGQGIPDPRREARLLLRSTTPGALADDSAEMTADEATAFFDLVDRRARREPMSHLLGYRDFYAHRFVVTPDVLDPRPETETLVEAALSAPFDHVLDLGTGSGAILLSLLAARPHASGLGADISADALDVARQNAERLGVADRCLFLNASWYDGVEGRFDLIVSNPPYIATDEMAGLAPELAYEPRLALTDDGDGLSAYRAIVPSARAHLRPGGRLMVEIGWRQGADVAAMFRAAGFDAVTILPDLDGRDRVVIGTSPE